MYIKLNIDKDCPIKILPLSGKFDLPGEEAVRGIELNMHRGLNHIWDLSKNNYQ